MGHLNSKEIKDENNEDSSIDYVNYSKQLQLDMNLEQQNSQTTQLALIPPHCVANFNDSPIIQFIINKYYFDISYFLHHIGIQPEIIPHIRHCITRGNKSSFVDGQVMRNLINNYFCSILSYANPATIQNSTTIGFIPDVIVKLKLDQHVLSNNQLMEGMKYLCTFVTKFFFTSIPILNLYPKDSWCFFKYAATDEISYEHSTTMFSTFIYVASNINIHIFDQTWPIENRVCAYRCDFFRNFLLYTKRPEKSQFEPIPQTVIQSIDHVFKELGQLYNMKLFKDEQDDYMMIIRYVLPHGISFDNDTPTVHFGADINQHLYDNIAGIIVYKEERRE